MTDADAFANFHDANNSALLKFKQTTGITFAGSVTKCWINGAIKVYKQFWKTREMPLVHCEINLILTWLDKWVLSNDTKATTFTITDTKLYVPVATLSTQDNAELFQ